ncbi:hypothetical protein NOK12_23010 [Nocardioides sp. OK12]|uniref:hypothetical protein n=1 Tax=Nocardioides sp. OK12 TaxID=2758661 RepID=UPI0021C3946B|nr:hypothetical protein [Nocardioides sp. OK12]GHJ59783.1 hypothetical protein NOK12_23010 [Nocardioides sp. OK12]
MTDAQDPSGPTTEQPTEQPDQQDALRPTSQTRGGPRWRVAALVAAGVVAGGSLVGVVGAVQGSDDTAAAVVAEQTAVGATQPAQPAQPTQPDVAAGPGGGRGGPGGVPGGPGGGAVSGERVEGTIGSLSSSSIEVETADGSQTYLTTDQTVVVRGGEAATTDDLVEGEQVLLLASAASGDGDLVAVQIMAAATEPGTAT